VGNYRKHWFALIGVLIVTFSLLGYYGAEVYRQAPPIPDRVVTAGGEVLYTQEGILDGQTAWQSVGGMQLGSIWGHGATRRPTGRPTGCTASSRPGSTSRPSAPMASRLQTSTPLPRPCCASA